MRSATSFRKARIALSKFSRSLRNALRAAVIVAFSARSLTTSRFVSLAHPASVEYLFVGFVAFHHQGIPLLRDDHQLTAQNRNVLGHKFVLSRMHACRPAVPDPSGTTPRGRQRP